MVKLASLLFVLTVLISGPSYSEDFDEVCSFPVSVTEALRISQNIPGSTDESGRILFPTRVYEYRGEEDTLFICKWLVQEGECRIFKQPNGPFAVIQFEEDPVGNYVGIVYWERNEVRGLNEWSEWDRFWQDYTWCRDVSSLAWGMSGRYLYVASSNIYGTGCVYRLDLWTKTCDVVYPNTLEEAGAVVTLKMIEIALNGKELVVEAELRSCSSGREETRRVSIPYE